MTTPTSTEIPFLELHEVSTLIRTRQLSSREITEAMLERIERLEPRLQAFATVMAESALAEADRADALLSRGNWLGDLHGVPVAVKDLANTHDAPTGAGTTIHADFRPDFDATVVARLRTAGAVILGKLRLTEGAFTGHHPDLPTPVNPWDADTWSGVSSSGSGVATAAGLATLKLTTELDVYSHIGRAADILRPAVASALEAEGIAHVIQSANSMFSVFFTDAEVTNYDCARAQNVDRYTAFFNAMLDQGIHMPPSAFEAWFLSYAHTDEILDRIISALPAAAKAAAAVPEAGKAQS